MNDKKTNFAEKTASMTTRKIDVNVVVFSAHGLLYEWFVHDLAVYDDRVSIFAEGHLRSNLESAQHDTNLLFHHLPEVLVHLWSSVARNLKAARRRNIEMV